MLCGSCAKSIIDTRSAGDYERLLEGGDENWSHHFADIFMLVHVTNRHTNRVLYSTLLDLSDSEVIARLLCNSDEEPLELPGVREREPGAFQDCKTTLIFIDLRGAGVRVAQLTWAELLMVDEDVDLEERISLYACVQSPGLYSLGLEHYPKPVYISCGFIANDLGDHGAGEDAERILELRVFVELHQMINDDSDDLEPRSLDEVSAAYAFLEPFVQSPSLLEWR